MLNYIEQRSNYQLLFVKTYNPVQYTLIKVQKMFLIRKPLTLTNTFVLIFSLSLSCVFILNLQRI